MRVNPEFTSRRLLRENPATIRSFASNWLQCPIALPPDELIDPANIVNGTAKHSNLVAPF